MDLNRYLAKPLYRKIVAFFAEHPESIDSPRGVATWIRASRDEVGRALEVLTRTGILVAHRGPTTTGYSLTRDAQLVSKIQHRLAKGQEP